jgi:DNA-binding transcriptional MocR family regulator
MTEQDGAAMTWQEKRERRFAKWLDTGDIKFRSPAARELYRERATRMIKAIKMEIPDRVPVHIPGGAIVGYNAGCTLKDLLYDYTRIKPAFVKWLQDYEQDSNDPPNFFSGRAFG